MKLFKRTVLFALTLCMAFGACALAACSESDGDEKVQYTVTVVSPTGAPMQGLTVKFGSVKTAYTTLDGGNVTANLAGDSFELSITGFDPIYKYTAATVNKDAPDKKVQLEWNPEDGKIVYSVTVTLPDGTPVKGMKIGLCLEENCSPLPDPTDENGTTYTMGKRGLDGWLRGFDPGNYEVQIISGIPEGYGVKTNESGHYADGTLTANVHSITVVLTEE